MPSKSDLRNLGISASAQRDHRRHNARAFHVSFYCLRNNGERNFAKIKNNVIKIISFFFIKLSSNFSIIFSKNPYEAQSKINYLM